MRGKLVIGSLVGAVVIQGALIACRDVLILGDEDSGMHTADASGDLLDVAEATAVDAIDAVLDIPEARADGGVDGGPACMCQPAPKPTVTFSGSVTQNGVNLIRGEYSTVVATHMQRLVNGNPRMSWTVAVRTYLTTGGEASVTCVLDTTPQGALVAGGANNYCQYSVSLQPGQSGASVLNTNQQFSSATITDTEATLGIPPITQDGITISFSVHLTEPSGGIFAIPNAYVP